MRLLVWLCVPLLAACVQPAAEGAGDACGAAGYQGLLGQPEAVLRQMQFPASTRIIGPRDAVTDDYRIDRLNFEIGEGGRIEKIACY